MYVRPSLTRFKKSKKGYLTTLMCTAMFLILASSDISPSTIKIPDWKMQDLVKVIAVKNHLNPHLVMSIINVESSWKPKMVSSRGALGLMQVMPAWIPHLAHLGIRSKEDLLDPEKNIAAGCYVLKVHLKEESHSLHRALNAYSGRSKGYAKKVLVNLAELEKRAQGKSEEHRIM